MSSLLTPLPDAGANSLYRHFSTNSVSPRSRRDYWLTHAFKSVEAIIPKDSAFYGHSKTCEGPRGQFVHSESSALGTRMTTRRLSAGLSDKHIAICVIHAGEYIVEQSDGRQLRFGPGDLFMFDCGQPMRASWSESSVSYLRLPRQPVARALGRDPDYLGCIASKLSNARLAPFLIAQLTLLNTHGARLRSEELYRMLDATIELAHFLLQAELSTGNAHEAEGFRNGRLRCAYRFIEENLHVHGLGPDRIASAIHCSRAQLYRLFETQPLSVKEAVREARLRKSRHYLEQPHLKASIGEIAHACGFVDQSTFGKLFRQRFHMTPSDVRRLHRAD